MLASADGSQADEISGPKNTGPALHFLPVAHNDLLEPGYLRQPPLDRRFTRYSPLWTNIVSTDGPRGRRSPSARPTPRELARDRNFQHVFWASINPYDLTKHAADLRVAHRGPRWPAADTLSTGSDTGGSLRQSAAFCNFVGFGVVIGAYRPGAAFRPGRR